MKGNFFSYIPPDAGLVLEIGCGTGRQGARYKTINPSGKYWAIESDQNSAKLAASVLDAVFTVDWQRMDMQQIGIHGSVIDCLVYGDRLETLDNPEMTLRKYAAHVREGGQMLLEISNIQYRGIIEQYLLGQFQGNQRFFSLDEAVRLLKDVGLTVFDIKPYGPIGMEHETRDEELAEVIEKVTGAASITRERVKQQLQIQGYFLRAVKGPMPSKLLIQTILGETKVCSRVRIEEPDQFSSTIPGIRTVSAEKTADLSIGRADEQKVFIRQRIWADLPEAAQQVKALLDRGYLVISEIDDDPLRWEEFHAKNDFYAFRACHGVQTSTPVLAGYLRQFNPNVAVFPNQLAYLPPARQFDSNKPVTIFFGALNRENDWKPILPALQQTLSRYGEKVQCIVIHDRKFFDALPLKRKQFIPFCKYDMYQRILHSSDIALLPLEANRFNSMKSDLKFIECAAHGAVALASPTVYQDTIIPGYTGMLYYSAEEFAQKLLILIEDNKMRQQISTNAYQWMKNNRLLSHSYRNRAHWYQELFHAKPELDKMLYAMID